MWVDGHLDLAYLSVGGRDLRIPCDEPDGCISLPALREAGVDLIFATIYTSPRVKEEPNPGGWTYAPANVEEARRAGIAQLDVYRSLEDERELSLVRSAADLEARVPLPKIVLLMEGADPITSADDVQWWHERGLRMVGLTWAAGTRYATGNAHVGGLTEAGRDLVVTLDDCGMIHDVSHLADGAFDELAACAQGQLVATHSNCRTLLNENQRHLRDDQILEIGRRNGVIGLNLFTKFLTRKHRASVDDCVAHIEHIAQLLDHKRAVGLGSDMDGGFGPQSLPVELDHPACLDRLSRALQSTGWSDADVRAFQSENWMAVLRRALPD